MSSRHEIPARDRRHEVAIGWDNPMRTFFGQVIDTTSDEELPVFWVGSQIHEVDTPDTLARLLAPYAEISPAMIRQLRTDRLDDIDRRPTPLQQLGATLFTENR